MTILSDRQIRELCINQEKPMISPFVPNQVKEVDGKRILSYGLSSYGYDARVAPEFKIFTNINSTISDPLSFDENSYVDHEGDFCIIPPNSFVLTRTVEYFHIPEDVLVLVVTKSTAARIGVQTLATPLEPGWHGHVTLEFANTSPLPAKLYANQGGVQLLFLRGDDKCEVSYATRGGKYQGQTGITLPKG